MALAVEQSETAMRALIDREARDDRWHGRENGAVHRVPKSENPNRVPKSENPKMEILKVSANVSI